MRRIRRTPNYEFTVELQGGFMRLPREAQRSWYLGRILKEAAEELEHIDRISPDFLPGKETTALHQDRTQGDLDDDEIMEDWQIPVMARMAEIACASHGDILEIGFGRGVASGFIQEAGVRSHTVIECNDSVVDRFHAWQADHAKADIRLAHGLWQDELPTLGQFDGIFFHTYPLSDTDFVEQVVKSTTFAEHFFVHAARHLRPGGVLTYLTMEADSLGRGHQRAVLSEFSSLSLSMLEGLEIPAETEDAHWLNRMLIVAATK